MDAREQIHIIRFTGWQWTALGKMGMGGWVVVMFVFYLAHSMQCVVHLLIE